MTTSDDAKTPLRCEPKPFETLSVMGVDVGRTQMIALEWRPKDRWLPPCDRVDRRGGRRELRSTAWGALLSALVLSALSTGALHGAEGPPELSPREGFLGHSEGDGSLTMLLGKKQSFHVESYGYDQADGTFRLDQTVTFAGKKPQTRFWLIDAGAPHRYQASVSDAEGRVAGSSEGSRLRLRYRVKGPIVMTQRLELRPDGRTIDNVGTITLFGVPIGRLHETIVRQEAVGNPGTTP
ncbi:MAG: DUF3833 family protein [Thermoanaerobaculia bacterium]